MPTYEYECTKCGHNFEKFQSITARRVRTCPECKGRVNRLLGTGAGIIFKGSGFYQTDYRSASYQEGARKDKPQTSKSDKSSSSGSKKETGKSKNTKKAK